MKGWRPEGDEPVREEGAGGAAAAVEARVGAAGDPAPGRRGPSGLDRFHALPPTAAAEALSACCFSRRWVRRILELRPFPLPEALFAAAEEAWWRLDGDDWLEAFAAHPRIGERAAAHTAPGRGWSAGEQAGAAGMEEERAERLADLNRRYEERFGWVYLVCATGKSGDEMLEILEHRLGDDPEHELRVAAAEQAKITRLRLEKLLVELAETEEPEEEAP